MVERLGVSIYDYIFLASGVIFLIIGMALIRAGKKDTLSPNATPSYKHI